MWCLIVKLISPTPWCLDGALAQRPAHGIPSAGPIRLAPGAVPLRRRADARRGQEVSVARETR